MRRRIELREYGRARLALSPAERLQLTAAAGGVVRVEATTEPDLYEVVADSQVGTVVTRDVELLVRPKVPIDNLLYLLGAGIDDIIWWRTHFPYDSDLDLVAAMLAFFARTLRQSLAAGLIRSYRREHERMPALRGRIDFAELTAQPTRPFPIPCEYEDFTADNHLNRYLKAAVREALRLPGAPASVRQLLMRQLVHFEEVADVAVRTDALDNHHFTRLDEHYRTPVQLARLVLSRRSLADRAGGQRARTFVIDMNLLFERFVTQELRRLLPAELTLNPQAHVPLDVGRRVPMRPDILLRRDGRDVYVADIKYKLSATGIARTSDYYQLLAYATALDLDEGLLIYCLDGGERPPTSVTVRHTGTKLICYLLDVSGPVRDVDEALQTLADVLSIRARRSDETPGRRIHGTLAPSAAAARRIAHSWEGDP